MLIHFLSFICFNFLSLIIDFNSTLSSRDLKRSYLNFFFSCITKTYCELGYPQLCYGNFYVSLIYVFYTFLYFPYYVVFSLELFNFFLNSVNFDCFSFLSDFKKAMQKFKPYQGLYFGIFLSSF